jgi:hypothetical protein
MQRNVAGYVLIGALVTLATLPGCRQAPVAQQEAQSYRPAATVKDIMDSMIDPSADTLWDSVQTVIDYNGITMNAPRTPDEWANVRRAAVILVESSNLLVMPDRHIARPGEKAAEPRVELEPGEIEKMVNEDRQTWVTLAHGLQDVSVEALKAVDAKSTDAIEAAGEKLDIACENCHKKYWYPKRTATTATP